MTVLSYCMVKCKNSETAKKDLINQDHLSKLPKFPILGHPSLCLTILFGINLSVIVTCCAYWNLFSCLYQFMTIVVSPFHVELQTS